MRFLPVLGKSPLRNPPADPKPNPIPNITLPLTSQGGLFLGGFFPNTVLTIPLYSRIWLNLHQRRSEVAVRRCLTK